MKLKIPFLSLYPELNSLFTTHGQPFTYSKEQLNPIDPIIIQRKNDIVLVCYWGYGFAWLNEGDIDI